ncbi:hypothetical protein H4I96_10315 [Botrytis cinerea]
MSGTDQKRESELPLNMQFYDSERYQPSLEDVLTVKNTLFTLRPESPLPLELIDAIIDLSEYWPHTTTKGFFFPGQEEGDQNVNIIRREVTIRAGAQQRIRMGGDRADKGTYRGSYTWFDVGLERTYATRRGNSTCFFKAHINNTSNYKDLTNIKPPEHIPESPSFRLSNSNPDTQESTNEIRCSTQTISPDVENNPSYDRENDANPVTKYPHMFIHTLNPDNKILQKNKTATRVFEDHKITWRFNDDVHPESPEADELEAQGRGRETGNGEFIRNLKIGDVVTLWAKARFPGWANTVEDVGMDVYYAV